MSMSMQSLEEALPKCEDAFECYLCKKKFQSRADMDKHRVPCLLRSYDECEFCNKRHTPLNDMIDHVLVSFDISVTSFDRRSI
ncbi:unnamed protein product [Haemonchus placei]|uniref:C2H2-type domain-containing protein n=1 Tax=Haemonchus placei TaxID=6290 RepID=A0A0N4W7C0_HAEPC|nr:unnamed protein product [Haemonchus placei]